MDLEKLLKWGTEYLSDYIYVFVFTLRKPVARFQPVASAKSKASGSTPLHVPSTYLETRLNPELFVFLIISVFIGATLNSIIPRRPSSPDIVTTSVVTLAVWFAYSLTIYLACRVLSGKGNFWETISVSLQLLAVIYVVSSLVAFIWGTLSLASRIQNLLQSGHVRVLVDQPTILYYIAQFLLMIIYLPTALKNVYGLSWARHIAASIFPALLWTILGINLFLTTGPQGPIIPSIVFPSPTHTPTSTPSSTYTPTLTPTPTTTLTPTPTPTPTATPLLAIRTLYEHDSSVNSIAFSPDGAILASGADDRTVRVWRVSDGSLLLTLEDHDGPVKSVAFSPDGTILASGEVGRVHLWSVNDGVLLRTLEAHLTRFDNGGYGAWVVYGLAFSPNGVILASGATDNTIKLWRISDGTLLHTLKHTDSVNSVAFSPDEEMLASGSWDSVRIWRLSDFSLLYTLKNEYGGVAFSPDSAILAATAPDQTVRLRDSSDGTLLYVLPHSNWVQSIAFSPNGAILASGTSDGIVRLWQVADGTLLHTLEGHRGRVKSVAFSPDGTILAVGVDRSGDNKIWLWKVR